MGEISEPISRILRSGKCRELRYCQIHGYSQTLDQSVWTLNPCSWAKPFTRLIKDRKVGERNPSTEASRLMKKEYGGLLDRKSRKEGVQGLL